jgi:hypothetical protein
MRRLWCLAAPEARTLLCILFIRVSSVPARAGGRVVLFFAAIVSFAPEVRCSRQICLVLDQALRQCAWMSEISTRVYL